MTDKRSGASPAAYINSIPRRNVGPDVLRSIRSVASATSVLTIVRLFGFAMAAGARTGDAGPEILTSTLNRSELID